MLMQYNADGKSNQHGTALIRNTSAPYIYSSAAMVIPGWADRPSCPTLLQVFLGLATAD